jgi:hypothetical protein
MANDKITVNKLLQYCQLEAKRWNWDKVIFISSDDEWNDWHELFYWFTSDKREMMDCIDKWRLEDMQRYHKLDDIILLW